VIQRGEFIALLGGAATAVPLAARAQQPGKPPKIGFLGQSTRSTSEWVAAFVQRLRELGWIENSARCQGGRHPSRAADQV
jgi:putative tryptophan/tyrosine transport system substrate-binding protein